MTINEICLIQPHHYDEDMYLAWQAEDPQLEFGDIWQVVGFGEDVTFHDEFTISAGVEVCQAIKRGEIPQVVNCVGFNYS